MQSRYYLLATSAVLAATLSASVASAQTAPAAQPAAPAAASNTIEELVVTAQKRSENLQDVPVAISAFTSEKRDLIGVTSIQDLTNFTPGLNYGTSNDRPSMRGIGRLTNQHPIASGVAIYSDGIYTTSTTEAGKSPIFTDREEVLRGPQGTLYGRNSMGGAINIISKRPTDEFEGEVRGTYGNYNHSLLEAAISGPITDNIQYRLAGNWEKQTDGYFTNVVPGMPSEGNVIDQFYVEGQLQGKWDQLEGWVKVATEGWNNGSGGPGGRTGYSPAPFGFGEFAGSQNLNAYYACAPGGAATNVVNTSPLGCVNPASKNPRDFASNVAQTVSLDDTYIIATQWTYHMDGMDVKYIGGGMNYHYTLVSDQSNSGSISSYTVPVAAFNPALPVAAQPCPATIAAGGSCPALTVFPKESSTYAENFQNMSHEINFASTGNGALQWLGGLYYYSEGYKQPVFTTLPDQPQLSGTVISAVTGKPTAPDIQNRLYDDETSYTEQSYAAYGQVDWKFADAWKATAGLRYTHDKLSGVESLRVLCFASAACSTTPQYFGSLAPALDITAASIYSGPAAGATGPVTYGPDGYASRGWSAAWQAWTGTVGLQWDPDPDTMFYLRYNRGYNMGGFASGVTSTLSQFEYTAPEHVNDYEFGFKKEFGRTLQTNVAFYWQDFTGYQAPLSVINNSGSGLSTSQYVNIPRAVSRGVEIESIWQPIRNMQIMLTYAYDDSFVKTMSGVIDPTDPEALAPGAKPLTALTTCSSSATAGCDVYTGLIQRPQDLKGNELPNAPKNKVALNFMYTWDFDKGSLTPSVAYIWRDKQYSGLFTRWYDESPSWSQVDMRLTWKDRDNKYTVIAFVKNLFDTLGYEGGASGSRTTGIYSPATVAAAGLTPGLAASGAYGYTNAVQGISVSYPLTPPRTYGIEVQYRF